jgi:hypothetical protein
MWASYSPMKGMQNFLHGTVIYSSYYRKIPVTAFYNGENVQPQFLQVNRGIYSTFRCYGVQWIIGISDIAILNDFLCVSILKYFGEIKCMFVSKELKQKFDNLKRPT